jgi:hypothetical protein
MKAIQPVNIWSGGQSLQANNINMYVVNDNLSSAATFYYQLLKVETIDDNTSTQQ